MFLCSWTAVCAQEQTNRNLQFGTNPRMQMNWLGWSYPTSSTSLKLSYQTAKPEIGNPLMPVMPSILGERDVSLLRTPEPFPFPDIRNPRITAMQMNFNSQPQAQQLQLGFNPRLHFMETPERANWFVIPRR